MNNNIKFYAILAMEGVGIADSVRNEAEIRAKHLPTTLEVKVFNNYHDAHFWLYQRSCMYFSYMLGVDNFHLFQWPIAVPVNSYVEFSEQMRHQVDKVKMQPKFLPLQIL